MASKTPQIDTTVPLKDALADQSRAGGYDCMPCRLMGSATFVGLGIYSHVTGMNQIKQHERELIRQGSKFGLLGRKASVYGLSSLLVGLGVYRLYN